MTSQAQSRRPGRCSRSRAGVGVPSRAEIPEARIVAGSHTRDAGPEGRSRMSEVEAA
jgi:hypothetical protein